MSQLTRQIIQSKSKSTRYPRTVLVCAWCPDSSHTVLASGEEYTHGICKKHLAEWTNKVRKRLHN